MRRDGLRHHLTPQRWGSGQDAIDVGDPFSPDRPVIARLERMEAGTC
jgi:hypothetical protein